MGAVLFGDTRDVTAHALEEFTSRERGGQGKYARVDFEVIATREVQSPVGSRGEKDKATCGWFYSPSTKKKYFFVNLI